MQTCAERPTATKLPPGALQGGSFHIIGLTGKARSGKDTVGCYIADAYGYTRYAMAGPLKAMLHAGLDLDPADYQTTEQKESVIPGIGVTYRHLAQTLGTEWGRDVLPNPDLWLRVARRSLEAIRSAGSGVVITDIRFNNEAEMVRDLGGTVLHVLRNRDSELSMEAQAHASEAGVTVKSADHLVLNYGDIPALYSRVDQIMGLIGGYQC